MKTSTTHIGFPKDLPSHGHVGHALAKLAMPSPGRFAKIRRSLPCTSPHGRQRGSILAATMFLSVLATMTALWLVLTMMDNQHENVHRRELSRAFLAADSGVDLVKDWGNNPADYDGDGKTTGLFIRNLADGTFPNLAALGASGVTVPASKLPTFTSKYSIGLGSIESLKIEPKAAGDPASLFKIECVGRSETGSRRKVVAFMDANPLATEKVALPAGLLSLASAAQAGNSSVHWGEAWSKSTFNVLNKSQSGNLDRTSSSYDKWARYRTEATLNFPSNWNNNFTGGTPKKNSSYDLNAMTRNLGTPADLGNGASVSGNYSNGQPSGSATEHSSFEQNIPPGVLAWPNFLTQYQTFKDQAMATGRYYATDASGNVYRDRQFNPDGSVKSPGVLKDFSNEFGEANRETSPYDLVFIDTTNGQPPAANGSNMATVSNSGTGIGMKGVFWIGANFAQTGAGNPAGLLAEAPPDPPATSGAKVELPKVYLDGVLYAAGTMNFGGNPVIYGSVVAEKGYTGGGTPDIWYNYKLRNGLELPKGNVGSVFYTVRHRNDGMMDD